MLKKAAQQGRSERRPEAYPLGYVEGLSDARTTLADFFSILLYLHRLGYVGERRFGDLAGPAAALCHDVVQARGIFAQARARVPHRRHAFDDSIGDELFAIDTADGGCPAFGINLFLNHRQ